MIGIERLAHLALEAHGNLIMVSEYQNTRGAGPGH
jgi:hypothetical protein